MSEHGPGPPDRFFTAEQIARLQELMAVWRTARDTGAVLDADEQVELDGLVSAELQGMIERTRERFGHRDSDLRERKD